MTSSELPCLQSSERKRCGCCQRWQGTRLPGEMPGTVRLADELATGLCGGGPWNGSERRARSACGHWLLWEAIASAEPD